MLCKWCSENTKEGMNIASCWGVKERLIVKEIQSCGLFLGAGQEIKYLPNRENSKE